MSDAPEKEKKEKKKGGKLPIIIALVVVLGAGGYFATSKKKGPEKPVKEVPKLGTVMDLGEFTVNIGGSASSYLRAKISVHLDSKAAAGGGDGHGGGGGADPSLQDVVVQILSEQSAEDILSSEGKNLLRRRLAYELNHRMHQVHPAEEKDKKEEEESKEKDKEKSKDDEEGHDKESSKDEEHGDGHGGTPWLDKPEYPDFDSDEGPVLKVYLTDLAVQE